MITKHFDWLEPFVYTIIRLDSVRIKINVNEVKTFGNDILLQSIFFSAIFTY